MFNSPQWKEQLIEDMAEHFTVWELRAVTRFFGGEGKSMVKKMGRFMGDAIPRAVENTNRLVRGKDLGRK
jgi:hypothetical protein